MARGRNGRRIGGFMRDFQEFALRGNVMDLAIGVIIGAAFGKIITSLTEDIIMPLLNPLVAFAGTDWREFGIPIGTGKIAIGSFLGNILDFVIIAFALYLAIRAIAKFKRKEETAPPAPSEQECPYCLEKIPLAATRCRACTSELTPTVERL